MMARRKKKNRELQKLITCIVIFVLMVLAEKNGLLAVADNNMASINKDNIVQILNYEKKPEIIERVSTGLNIDKTKLNIIYFYVGQADCILVMHNDSTMLIDSGNSADGDNVINAIKTLGVEKLDVVVGTHVHEDHIGCMSDIIDNFEIGKFYLPYNATSTTSFYKRLLKSLTAKNMGIDEATIGEKFNIGNAECEIMMVDNSDPENINEESIALELRYGAQKYLFMGDAEVKNEKARVWEDVDVLKVGHHGSNTSSSEDFLKQVKPEISIISVGKDNSYGLPKKKIINRLKKYNSIIYRTDEDGTIQLVSDGNTSEIVKVDINLDGN